YDSVKRMKNGEIALSVVNGHVRNSEQEEIAKLLRKKSQLILAFGACSCFGGTPGLANLTTKTDIFNWVYRDAPTVVNPDGNYPQEACRVNGEELTLPKFYSRVYPLNAIVDVDYYLPGCPPPPYLVMYALSAVLENKLPAKGSTLAPHRALCDSCKRNKSKPDRISIREIKRIHEVEADPDVCFLARGIICLGPATRDGCGESCMNINIPCRGCFGPVEGVEDSGAKFVSTMASILDAESDEEIANITGQLVDPVGYLYRFLLPASILQKER
ncbi:MAG: oxidoreductase, partial [Dehalococcoidia bacterium]|nr:oxidoreductase [Dehalococcoidia bacterium]